jgi:CBS domain-containing protein
MTEIVTIESCGARVVSATSPVTALVCRPALAVAPDATIAEAAAVLRSAGVSSLLVGDRTAIVTERDLARALADGRDPSDPVATVATAHPVTVRATTSVMAAAAVMLNEEVRHLVVELDDGVGIISMRDVLAVLLQCVDPHFWLRSLQLAIETPAEIWLG